MYKFYSTIYSDIFKLFESINLLQANLCKWSPLLSSCLLLKSIVIILDALFNLKLNCFKLPPVTNGHFTPSLDWLLRTGLTVIFMTNLKDVLFSGLELTHSCNELSHFFYFRPNLKEPSEEEILENLSRLTYFHEVHGSRN